MTIWKSEFLDIFYRSKKFDWTDLNFRLFYYKLQNNLLVYLRHKIYVNLFPYLKRTKLPTVVGHQLMLSWNHQPWNCFKHRSNCISSAEGSYAFRLSFDPSTARVLDNDRQHVLRRLCQLLSLFQRSVSGK